MELPLRSLFTFNTPPPAFGLDLSSGSMRILQLRSQRLGSKAIDFIREIDVPPGVIVDGEIKDKEKIQSLLSSAIEAAGPRLAEAVVASLPEPKTFAQTFAVPKQGDIPFLDRVSEVITEYFPLTLDEMYFDASVVSEDDSSWLVTAGAAPQTVVHDYLELFEKAKLIPLALDLEASAIMRSVLPTPLDDTPRALIDLGRRRTSFILTDHGALQFTMSLPISGDEVTQRISERLDLTAKEAREAKHQCGLDEKKCDGALRVVLNDMVEDLVTRINDAREYYQSRFPQGRDIEELVLCGGGAELLQLPEVLGKTLAVPVRIADPWEITGVKKPQGTAGQALHLTTVIGLAERAGRATIV